MAGARPGGCPPRRGSALIMAMVIVAVLALVATAFIATARLEARAATNGLRGVQAEWACRSGLAAAIARTQAVYALGGAVSLYDSAGDSDAWRQSFYDAAGPDLCPDSWVAHYDNATTPKWEMKAGKWTMPRIMSGDPCAPDIRELKRSRGFTAEYYVAVADLDGKLHCNPKYFANLLDDGQTEIMVGELGVPNAVRDALKWDNTVLWSLGQLRSRLPVGFADDPGTTENELNLAEKVFTVYPRVTLIAAKGDVGRPPVNVNTARPEVLKAIVFNVRGLKDVDGTGKTFAARVAEKLVAKRLSQPFASRKSMEKALVELGDASIVNLPVGYAILPGGVLDEQRLNDLLNSLAGSIAAGDSDLDDAATPGFYHYDFNGDGTCAKGTDYTSDTPSATWGTEVKFTSRFYHVYVLGRTVAENDGRTLSERRLHAVYDAQLQQVLWSRWHFAAKANAAD
jgi:hypothetical protein